MAKQGGATGLERVAVKWSTSLVRNKVTKKTHKPALQTYSTPSAHRSAPTPRVHSRPQPTPRPRVHSRPQPRPRVHSRPAPRPRVHNRPAPRPRPHRSVTPRPHR